MSIPYEQIAGELLNAHRTRTPIEPVSSRYPDITLEEAQRIGRLAIQRREEEGARIIGKKIGFTNKKVQGLMGVEEPVYGYLMSDALKSQNERIDTEEMLKPFIEIELCFVMKERLQGPHIMPFDVLRATAGVMCGIEIPDSRYNGRGPKPAADSIADNVGNAFVVLGDVMTSVSGIDFSSVGIVLEKNHKVLVSSSGAAVLGNPLYSVTWLANKLAEAGEAIEAGDLIFSGSMTPIIPEIYIQKGDLFEAHFSGLGSVRAMF